MGKRIVIVGAGFAGLTAALELREQVGSQHEIVVLSKSDEFVFQPSLVWVPFGLRSREDICFPLAPIFESRNIDFRRTDVKRLDLSNRRVDTAQGELAYDYLVIATGAQLDWSAVPGLGPTQGHTQSIFSMRDAERAQTAFERFLLNPGPIVIGAVQGASYFGAAYELAFNMAHHLRKRGPAGWTQLTFLTPEPFIGHLGLGGFGSALESTRGLMNDLHINQITNAAVREVESKAVVLTDGRRLPFDYAMLTPPFVGADVVRACEDIVDVEGFVKVDEFYRTHRYPEVFAAGTTISIPQPSKTDVPVGVPKTGQLADGMARVVAKNVAAAVNGRAMEARPPASLASRYLLDAGNTGFALASDALLDRENETFIRGPEARWAKLIFEKYFLATRRRGIV